jgi:hypothetical protein
MLFHRYAPLHSGFLLAGLVFKFLVIQSPGNADPDSTILDPKTLHVQIFCARNVVTLVLAGGCSFANPKRFIYL